MKVGISVASDFRHTGVRKYVCAVQRKRNRLKIRSKLRSFDPHFSIKKSNIWFQFWKSIVLSFFLRCTYIVCVTQKLQISEFFINLFVAWNLVTLPTSQERKRCQLSYEIMFVGLEWKLGRIRLRFPKKIDFRRFRDCSKKQL